MFKSLKNFFISMDHFKSFSKLKKLDTEIVFYLESYNYWIYFESIFNNLIQIYNKKIIYVTSDINDKMLASKNINFKTYYIGTGIIRTIFFSTLNVKSIILTMPDLNNFHIKKSKYKVKYIYLHHSLVSTHMIYNEKAFDSFDAIICVGKHHIREIREREKKFNLKKKILLELGYPKLDVIINRNKNCSLSLNSRKILIAPTWNDVCLIETFGIKIIRKLIENNFKVILRPHPITLQKKSKIIKLICDEFKSSGKLSLDTEYNSLKSFYESEIMISDWSGSALEFAFGLCKPVLFINTPKKILNKNYTRIKSIPIEIFIRNKIGLIINTSDLDKIDAYLADLFKNQKEWKNKISNVREYWLYNKKKSGKLISQYLNDI